LRFRAFITMPRLAEITIYPIKSLPGLRRTSAIVTRYGGLEFDRRWAICDTSGEVVNGKRTAAVHDILANFDDPIETVTLSSPHQGRPQTFAFDNEREEIEAWLSTQFGFDVVLLENLATGYPDDLEAPGPTLVSTATLEAVATWFDGLTLDETRRRFRANLEIDGVEAFWEDRLVGEPGQLLPFHVGNVSLEGVNSCQRCIVPTRDSSTGEMTHGFSKHFAEQRAATLPPWAPRARFNHFYRLAVNTAPPIGHRAGTIAVGDEVTASS
jgi:MOSC domain-containing protein